MFFGLNHITDILTAECKELALAKEQIKLPPRANQKFWFIRTLIHNPRISAIDEITRVFLIPLFSIYQSDGTAHIKYPTVTNAVDEFM